MMHRIGTLICIAVLVVGCEEATKARLDAGLDVCVDLPVDAADADVPYDAPGDPDAVDGPRDPDVRPDGGIDECALGIDACDDNAICTDIPDGYTCTCEDGYEGDGWTCNDIDECADGTHTCDVNATCINTHGGFTCDCNDGFSGSGFTCTDIDECARGTDSCDANATCTNTTGSYACACNSGYTGDGFTCSDVDECALGTDLCDTNATCTNTAGSYTCTCNSGYTGSGYTCSPIDHCSAGTHTCDVHATCTYTGPGTYDCACNIGWTGDGYTCTPDSGVTVIEDFETGTWPWTPWVEEVAGGTVGTASAHDGVLGIRDVGWHYRTDVTFGTTSGEILSVWVRQAGTMLTGRAYLGFASDATGTRSVVFGANTDEFQCQDNAGWTFTVLATVSQTYTVDTWYRIEVEYTGGGSYTARLFASDGTTLLNSLVCDYGAALPGGVAIRSIMTVDLDTVLLM